MLELKNIVKTYTSGDDSVDVLKDVSLVFREKEFVSVLGPSGCGKTTMLNIIGGLDHYSSGELFIDNRTTKEYKTRDWDTYRNHTIGFVFQSYNLIPHQNVIHNVALALSIRGVSRKERMERAKEALIRVGLEDHMYKKPSQLSGGQSQRVAIARALIGNPSVILADEPTGALDTETSIQVMDILKDLSKDHLVIMVTHNPDLAHRYSTREIDLLDGRITGDSNPVTPEEYKELTKAADERRNSLSKTEAKREARKSSMSFLTSTGLSASNLWTKKRKTILTALACSIGIIGIATVLSVSGGMSDYIAQLESDSSAMNYIMINEATSLMSNFSDNMGAIMSSFSDADDVGLEEYPAAKDTTGVYFYEEEFTGDIITTAPMELNETFINWLEENIHGDTDDTDLTLGIDYSRAIGLNLITEKNGSYSYVDYSDWSEMFNSKAYMDTQYTILSGSGLPTEYNEISLVVDKYNRISTSVLNSLGIDYSTASGDLLPYDQIVGKEIKLVANDDIYTSMVLDTGAPYYSKVTTQEGLKNAYDSDNSVTLKIVSVIRREKDAASDWLPVGMAYLPSLTDKVFELNMNSEVVQAQIEYDAIDILTGQAFADSSVFGDILGAIFGISSSTYYSNMVLLGGDTTPDGITIYPKDIASKDKILEKLDYWNNTEVYKIYGNDVDEEGNYIADQYRISYIDLSATIVGMLNTIINIISTVLIVFSCISLVVSSIMIAIITWASVIERTKEIGTIRSLGGRQRDVWVVFIMEAVIIGLVSACIALLVTWIIDVILNAVLTSLFGVAIANLTVGVTFGMLGLGAGVNLIAAIIPAAMAARKDPVVALRTE